jgi:hypothetical protein
MQIFSQNGPERTKKPAFRKLSDWRTTHLVAELVPVMPLAPPSHLTLRYPRRHGQPCAGHPDMKSAALQSIGITGTRPVMT